MNTPASPPPGQVYRLYYYVGGQRVAVRRRDASGDELTYIFGDHLGSTSVTADANGTLLSRTLYHPWGTVRYQTGALPTDYTYTGQYSYTDAFGLMYYNARWYDPALGRFAQADTLIPGAGNPLAWDRYAYTLDNPLRYSDPSGHCWDAFNFIRGIPGYDTTCNNLDMALNIVESDRATAGQKVGAGAYIALEGTAHTALLVGTGMLAWEGASAAIGAIGAATAGSTAVTAACADGDCANEVSALTQADLPAIERFVQEASQLNIDRGYGSFGSWWSNLAKTLLESGNSKNMFLNRVGEKITGMMYTSTANSYYEIKYLEGMGGGAGTNLFMRAIQDSMAKGFGGSIYLAPAEKALEWYLTNFPGAQLLADGRLYWSAEAAKAILNGQ